MEKIQVSNSTYKKLEKIRPKGKTMNRVIVALLKKNKMTKEEVLEMGF